jgi:hypothetical protein
LDHWLNVETKWIEEQIELLIEQIELECHATFI